MPHRRPALLLALAVLAATAHATPDADDLVGRLIAERAWAHVAEPAPAPSVRDRAADLVITALNFLGLPYRRGGSSVEAGFDCSGFTRHIFEQSLGLVLPRRVDEQAGAAGLVAVRRNELQPGDLVFFNTLKRTFSHVGIYVGDGKFIHSPKPGAQVRVENMRYAYWTRRYSGARRASAAVADASPNP